MLEWSVCGRCYALLACLPLCCSNKTSSKRAFLRLNEHKITVNFNCLEKTSLFREKVKSLIDLKIWT